MKAKTHSILTVVNAHADVERSLQERSEVDIDPQMQNKTLDHLPSSPSNRIDEFYRGKSRSSPQVKKRVSWGILFGSEYIWAPDIGPMLIVCPTKATSSTKQLPATSNSPTISNCCILQFENQLSTRSPLRIFHSY
jgi:hypothetical protein